MLNRQSVANSVCIFFLVLALAGCGSGGGGGGNESPASSGSGSTPSATLPAPTTNTVMLYVVTESSNSQYFPEYDITLDSDTQQIIRYIPSQQHAEVVKRNYSPSWAPSTVVPYTVDDRYFEREEFYPFEYSGTHDFTEYDPLTGTQLRYFSLNDPNDSSHGCSAIVGNSYYYQVSRTWDVLYGYLGGEFKRADFGGTLSVTQLYPWGDANNCRGNLVSTAGKLYDADYTAAGALSFYKRNLATGAITETRTVYPSNFSSYNQQQATFDGSTAYYARQRASDGLVELYSYSMDGLASSQMNLIYSTSLAGFTLNYIDADDGKIALGSGSGKVIVYDTSTNVGKAYNFGFSIYGVQILYIRS